MKVAINKKYKYITFEEHCPEGLQFGEWVMQDEFETHSIVDISDNVDNLKIKFEHFDYDETSHIYTFNIYKYNEYIEELNKPKEATEIEIQQQIINTLGQELAMLKIQFMMGGM